MAAQAATFASSELVKNLLRLLVLVVGALFLLSCQNDDERVADIIQRFLLAGRGEVPTQIERFVGELPDDLPAEPPRYPDSDILTSTRLRPGAGAVDQATGEPLQGAVFFILLDSSDQREQVFRFYERALDEEPWQLEQIASSEEVDRLDFSNVADADITGAVSLVQGEEDEATSVLIFLQDAGASTADERFKPGSEAILPEEFPSEVPAYERGTVISTGFLRQPGTRGLLLQFITTDSEDDVLDFYRKAFEDNGWTVEEGEGEGGGRSLRFDGRDDGIEGDVTVDTFPEDEDYVLARVQLQLTGARQREETPRPRDEQPTEEEPTGEQPTEEPSPRPTLPSVGTPTG